MNDLRVILLRLLHHIGRRGSSDRERGQSMVEMALTFPVLLLVLAGSVEIGMYYNNYLTLVDATRESARFLADSDYENADLITGCLAGPPFVDSKSKDFYNLASCIVLKNIFGVAFDKATDDIVVSVFTVQGGSIIVRYPHDDPAHKTLGDNPQNGWSYCLNILKSVGCTPAASFFDNSAVLARLTAAPDTGLVLVEIYHLHHQFLGLIPPDVTFMPQTVMMHAYTIMPNPSAASLPE